MAGLFFDDLTVVSAPGTTASSLTVSGRRVAAIGGARPKDPLVIQGGSGFLLPGLINAHDHLGLNHYPRTRFRESYTHAVDWFADMETQRDRDPNLVAAGKADLESRLWLGGLKNLLAGTTTVAHHNPLHRCLRQRFWHAFWPGRDRLFATGVVQRFGFAHSWFRGPDPARTYAETPADWPWIIHLAEGTDRRAAGELPRLEAAGALGPNTLIVHGVGLTRAQRARMVAVGAGLIWCPASNQFLIGTTADVTELAHARRVALGTDARLTGSRDLLAELKVAVATGQLEADPLLEMVTSTAAALLRLKGPGTLLPGAPADLILVPALADDAARALLQADRADLRLVLRAGRPVIADVDLAPVFAETGVGYERVTLDGRPKIMAGWLTKRVRRLSLKEPGLRLDYA